MSDILELWSGVLANEDAFILLAIILVFMAYLSFFLIFIPKLDQRRQEKRDSATSRLGISVAEVDHDVLMAKNTYTAPDRKEKMLMTRYAIAHRSGSRDSWTFFQRIPEKENRDSLYGEYYAFRADAPAPPVLEEILLSFVDKFSEGVFDLEKTDRGIVLYWDEYGSDKLVEELYGYMDAIRKFENDR